jgi:ABC-type multidrug transport system ATPase subunit
MDEPTPTPVPEPAVSARGLGHAYPGSSLFEGLDCTFGPGLSLIRGGDGRGKTTLLRILAGTLAPATGSLTRHTASVCLEHPTDPADDDAVARAWLATRRARHPAWSTADADGLAEAFGLVPHLDKPLYMLSTGSRRKLGLVAAAASGAALTLLDMPYAALDVPSSRVVTALLHDAAAQRRRTWVVADHERPAAWAGLQLATVIDLGD